MDSDGRFGHAWGDSGLRIYSVYGGEVLRVIIML